MVAATHDSRPDRSLVSVSTRADIDARILSCEQCRRECRDMPEVVDRMNDRLDLLHELHDAIPEQRDA